MRHNEKSIADAKALARNIIPNYYSISLANNVSLYKMISRNMLCKKWQLSSYGVSSSVPLLLGTNVVYFKLQHSFTSSITLDSDLQIPFLSFPK